VTGGRSARYLRVACGSPFVHRRQLRTLQQVNGQRASPGEVGDVQLHLASDSGGGGGAGLLVLLLDGGMRRSGGGVVSVLADGEEQFGLVESLWQAGRPA
jgi:hypothetical protein